MHPFGRHRRSGADQGQGRRLEAQGEFLITADWKVELDSDVDLWVVGPDPDALLERGVIVSPGEMFGPSGEGYVRFALVPTLEECQRAAEILGGLS